MNNVLINPNDDDRLPEPLERVVDGVNRAGQTAGEVAGGVVGVFLGVGTKAVTSLAGKSDSESDELATQVFEGTRAVGKTIGRLAPVAVLTAPLFIAFKLLNRK